MRFKTICRFLVLVQFVSAIFLALPTPQARAATPNAIYISEVAWAGSTLSTSDEWIELGNASASDVSIGGWKLFGAGSSDKVLVLPSDATIPAHGVYLISNYPMDDSHCALTVAPDAVTSTISLSNSALRIELRDVNSNLIDLAGDGQTPLAGYSQTLKANMIRVDIGLSGDDANAWGTANVSQNMYTPDFGTPGIIDFDFADEPVDETPPPIDVDETSATSTPATEPDLDQANTTSTEILSIDEVATSTESILTSTQ
ncbi:MAG: lamin tail domain-containing protein [Patescibacteria group bacterium]